MADRTRFLGKKWQPEFGPSGPKLDPKLGLCHFLKYCSLVFPDITYADSLQQCLTSSRDKIHEKKFLGPNLGQRGQNQA